MSTAQRKSRDHLFRALAIARATGNKQGERYILTLLNGK